MVRYCWTIALIAGLLAASAGADETNIAHSGEQVASRQSIPCAFTATVVRITLLDAPLPAADKLKGHLIDADPKWEIELKVWPHEKKMPFQPGVRKCYVADVQSVFSSPPDTVQGEYELSFVWNVDVPGRPEIESFKARKIMNRGTNGSNPARQTSQVDCRR